MDAQRIYALQENGQVTLPQKWRQRYGLKKGDVVSFDETPDGRLVVSPRVMVGLEAMNRISAALKTKGVSLKDLLRSGERIRQDHYNERYVPPRKDA